MSQWTHVNGCIRIDGLPGVTTQHTIIEVGKIIGNCVQFEDDKDIWDRCNVPCGSEGSLNYEMIEAGDGLVWLSVPIWGDLRDYHSLEGIRTWFEKVTLDEKLLIRSAVLEVHIEYDSTTVLYYQDTDGREDRSVGAITTWKYED